MNCCKILPKENNRPPKNKGGLSAIKNFTSRTLRKESAVTLKLYCYLKWSLLVTN